MSLEMETVNVEVYKSVHIRNASCLAAFVVLFYEYSASFAQEYQFVWKSRRTLVKWVYLFSRYFALGAQIANNVLLIFPLSKIPVRHELCKPWFLFLIISASMLLAALEIVLMLRVYAIYRRSSRVKTFFIVIFTINQLIVADYVRRASSFPFSGACEAAETPYEVIYPATIILLTQSIIWLMTVTKKNVAYGRAPIISLMIRDGAWIFVLICAILVVNIPYSLTIKAPNSHILFVWPMTLFSIGACRIILNMQSLSYSGAKSELNSGSMTTDVDVDFTQCIDVSLQSMALSQRHVDRNSDSDDSRLLSNQ
ncbi:hypothetical protein BDQ12DRAFT_692109 [Crucibulum laeve]|uniref:DUF6533 domain-containing protein n=1 Tax=Crucibulum laeve TaxID=68775 RepID=A0A5C3LJ51_9AGAR|nr:hypothetical protein BDQ12DRAFT_692109 [Crucibulum laeve]